MDSYELEPRYSTKDIPGKCIKCLGEQELNGCLMLLLSDEGAGEEVQKKYEALFSFLRSPESKQLREESERCLAEGKKVSVSISDKNGQYEYELKIE